MPKKINPNDPAFPTPGVPYVDNEGRTHSPTSGYGWAADPVPGMPIRLEIASRIMQGMASNRLYDNMLYDRIALVALCQADALIKEHNKTQS